MLVAADVLDDGKLNSHVTYGSACASVQQVAPWYPSIRTIVMMWVAGAVGDGAADAVCTITDPAVALARMPPFDCHKPVTVTV
jgi:hypothetical protein